MPLACIGLAVLVTRHLNCTIVLHFLHLLLFSSVEIMGQKEACQPQAEQGKWRVKSDLRMNWCIRLLCCQMPTRRDLDTTKLYSQGSVIFTAR